MSSIIPKIDSSDDTSAQSDSRFFRIPAEIRSAIYRYILVGHVFRITSGDDYESLRGDALRRACLRTCSLHGVRPNLIASHDQLLGKIRYLGLTMTCRKAYIETIRIVYEKNVLSIDKLQDLEDFRERYKNTKLFFHGNPPQFRHLLFKGLRDHRDHWPNTLPH